MPTIFALIEILNKYSEYLVTTNASMNKLHNSNENARKFENNSTIYRIAAFEFNSLNKNYIQLNNTLLEKQ
ncbi:2385_t:CDS:1, partial [Funneliformis geosporum]